MGIEAAEAELAAVIAASGGAMPSVGDLLATGGGLFDDVAEVLARC